MLSEPTQKRAIAFIEGQNLFHSAREAFGYSFPNYDVVRLSETLCGRLHWQLVPVRFYTGIPDILDDAKWHTFWSAKLGSQAFRGLGLH